ncbi:sensor histidine kinase [Solihabitans fulvus]|uniref:histidine kinase n=1 Tax=Solihabitans fulvus TaxID=1892852 RepID=A0A5B2WN90_9PSEU|nr:sensor histidine kinase [Solihabitans fulvus]KAA2252865.1 sensor histidine kinase [Solihabitans fulvus]
MSVTVVPHSSQPSPALRFMRVAQHVVFLVLLVVGVVQVLRGDGPKPWLLAGSALVLAWYAGGVVAARYRSRRWVGPTWLLVLTALWAVLVVASPAFAWVVFALFFLYMHLLPVRAAMVGVVLLTVGVVLALLAHGGGNPVGQIIGPSIGAAVAVGMASVYRSLAAESEQRRRLIDELVAAQEDLVAVHDELARVQREAGVLHERERLAREIHDTLAQGFSSVVLLARAARKGAPQGESLDEIERVAAENLAEARRLVRALAPPDLDNTPLSNALDRLTARSAEQNGGTARYLTEGTPFPLPTTHEVALLRVAQSALANVRQHANAGTVVVTLSYLPDAVSLDVVDDGDGFDPSGIETTAHSGFGLRAMRTRLAELGGALVVESAPHEGTAVAATIPVGGWS